MVYGSLSNRVSEMSRIRLKAIRVFSLMFIKNLINNISKYKKKKC